MKKSIYKITKKSDGKSYIGQAIRPYERFSQHCYRHEQYASLINTAINKYGIDAFSFEVLEWDIENYNEREKYWIQYFNTKAPNGYNLTDGGEEPPLNLGENNPNATHTSEQVVEVKRLLKETDLSLTDIANIVGYEDRSAIERINNGSIWKDPKEKYPIRKLFLSDLSCKERWKQVVDCLLNTDLPQREIAEICGIKRSAVTMINNGKNGSQWNDGSIEYPIRQGRHYGKNL